MCWERSVSGPARYRGESSRGCLVPAGRVVYEVGRLRRVLFAGPANLDKGHAVSDRSSARRPLLEPFRVPVSSWPETCVRPYQGPPRWFRHPTSRSPGVGGQHAPKADQRRVMPTPGTTPPTEGLPVSSHRQRCDRPRLVVGQRRETGLRQRRSAVCTADDGA